MYALPPFGKCEWGPDVTSEYVARLCPDLRMTTSEANRGVGSANVQRALEVVRKFSILEAKASHFGGRG